MMKFHFDPNLPHQVQAIDAVCDLFRGQELCRTEFTVTDDALDGARLSDLGEGIGVGNRLTLLDNELLKNLCDVQLRNGLLPSESLESGDFTVEMETGTGKTYVYLRTIFELNKLYGFSKFVIVVPSIAIKEGVYKTLETTAEHFRAQYAGVSFDYFTYDSDKLGQVRNFATSSHIQIMVVTVGAINKREVNTLYKESERTGGEKPIDLIRATSPIVIVDEPQSVDGGLKGAGKIALESMNPLCTLRYSATHVDKHHMVYRLDAVDAYERKLVKQIEVASATVERAFNKPFLRLISVTSKHGAVSAKVEVDVSVSNNGVRRKEITVYDGDDLEQVTNRAVYTDFRIGTIGAVKGEELLELRYPGGEAFLRTGDAFGDVDSISVQRQLIRRTIIEHLDKELRLHHQGIKVLSLFFIDEVSKYRSYDSSNNPVKGEYAIIFEEEYRRASRLPKYHTLFEDIDDAFSAEYVHDGYFSIDKKGAWSNTAENNLSNRESAERAYNLIMKDKEKLLSLVTPLKFIFSHSALKEGWDNPNVFQICSLREMGSERERRQTIGRGLRLCVNQNGDRMQGFEINTLTVIATESYEQFAEMRQKEIESETGVRFGILEKHQFVGIKMLQKDGIESLVSLEQSAQLWDHFRECGFIDRIGKVQDSLRLALKDDTVFVPQEFEQQRSEIIGALRKVTGRLEIKNADDRREVPLRESVYLSAEFKELWDRIKYRTTYRVQFDNEKLIKSCIAALRDAPSVTKTRLQWRKAEISIGKGGVEAIENRREGAATVILDERDIVLPDLLTELQDRTQLTRKSITKILIGSTRLSDFRLNPQQFIEFASEAINRCKRLSIVEGIKYERIGDDHFYAQELFKNAELIAYLRNMVMDAKKSVFENVVVDSNIEREFAYEMEANEAVKLYAKLPSWFMVPTPLGGYNPDWVVLVEHMGESRLYFVIETKGGLFADDFRRREEAKIQCAKSHFHALSQGQNPAKYILASSFEDVPI